MTGFHYKQKALQFSAPGVESIESSTTLISGSDRFPLMDFEEKTDVIIGHYFFLGRLLHLR
jgi:hypothetical protein